MRPQQEHRRGTSEPARGWPKLARIGLIAALGGFGWLPGGVGGAEPWPPGELGAGALHADGITGLGITIAAVVGDAAAGADVLAAADGHRRLLAVFDAFAGTAVEGAAAEPRLAGWRTARGSAPPASAGLASAAAPLEAMLSSRRDGAGRFEGVAPNADLVLVRALGSGGGGDPADVARGIDWVVANRDRYGIRVLAVPLAARPLPRTRLELLARAVVAAHEAGIVVVAPAGDGGPEAGTVTAPGDLPQVLAVGSAIAVEDGWWVAPYSAGGPTPDGLLKPDLVAPAGAGEPVSPAPDPGRPGRPAGTSISAALVGGAAALVLEAWPWLTPDEVKWRLMLSARPVQAPGGSLWRQGAGLLDARAAVDGPVLPGPRDDRAAKGITWSDSALRGLTWSDSALRGPTWSDEALRDGSWPGGGLAPRDAARGLVWSD